MLAFDIRAVFHPAKLLYNADPTGFGTLFSHIMLILTSIAAALSFIFIIIAGFKYATSSGDEKKLASASSTITYAIIGIVVTILSFVILSVVQYFFRSNIPVTA